MLPVRNFIVYSTFLGLFSSNLFFNVGSVHLLGFYFVIFLNLILLWLSRSLWVPRGLLLFLAFLVISGAIGLARGTDSLPGFSKAFLGILPTVIYFCAFLRYMDFDVERCFRLYARLAYYVALFGILYFPFQPDTTFGRLSSVLTEPGEFCIVCLPALFYYADKWQRAGQYRWRSLVLLLGVMLTFSSIGYMTMLFGLCLFGSRYKAGKFVMPILVVLSGLGLYTVSDPFSVRLDDSIQSLASRDMTGINASSFGVVSNIFVTRDAFLEHPFVGGGLGSHVVAHDRFAGRLFGTETFIKDGSDLLGRWDASSLLLRIISELGMVGLCCTIWFIWWAWPRGGSAGQRAVAMAVLIYIFAKFMRSGSYFNPEEFFFFVIYAVNGLVALPRPFQSAVIADEIQSPLLMGI